MKLNDPPVSPPDDPDQKVWESIASMTDTEVLDSLCGWFKTPDGSASKMRWEEWEFERRTQANV